MAYGETLKQPLNLLNVLGYRKACFVLMNCTLTIRINTIDGNEWQYAHWFT